MASITKTNRRRALERSKMMPSEASLWRWKRARQKADIASGIDGGWFTGELANQARAVNHPY